MRHLLLCSTILAIAMLPAPLAGSRAVAAAAPVFGRNLIVNGNAEADTGGLPGTASNVTPSGWATTGELKVLQYEEPNGGYGNSIKSSDPGPADRGKNYFTGGTQADGTSTGMQVIDVSAGHQAIDSGKVTFDLSAYLGGGGKLEDNAVLTATFKSGTGTVLGSAKIGPVTAADREDVSELLQRSTTGKVPAKTLSVEIELGMTYVDNPDPNIETYHGGNSGAADDLSFVLSAPALTVATIQPAQQATVHGQKLTFRWHGFPGATYYYLQAWLITPADGQTITSNSVLTVATRVSGTSYPLPTRAMAKGMYQWRMAALDANGAVISDWTPPLSFTLK
jgi:hypothetical protein